MLTPPPFSPAPQPKSLFPDEAIKYLSARLGKTISRRTFYNWIKIGRKGTKLAHWYDETRVNGLYTTTEACDAFASSFH